MDNGEDHQRQEGTERPPLPRYQMMAELVRKSPTAPEEFAQIIEEHAQFLASGGGGGGWSTFVTPGGTVAGLVLGVYVGPSGATPAGKQAVLDHHRLDGLDLAGAQLPFASLCGVSCRGQNLDGANLHGALLVDSDFTGSSFRGADLRGADLSRCDLVGCDFRDCDLRQADLENANVSGADMTGAKVTRARFAGALTEGMRGLNEPSPKPARPIEAGAGRRGPASYGGSGRTARPPAYGDHGRRPPRG